MVIDRFGGEDENYILYLLEIHKRMSNSDLCRALKNLLKLRRSQ